MRRTRLRGFTLVEAAVVMAIMLVLGAMAYDSMARSRPRATFNGVTEELRSLLHAARQQALSAGVPVVVLVFPNYQNGAGQGRIVVLQDDTQANLSLLNAAAPLHIGNYDPSVVPTTPNGQVVTTLDLPRAVQVVPGALAIPGLPFPYSGVNTTGGCPFCTGSGTAFRGAIVFDEKGRAQFWNGTSSAVTQWVDPSASTGGAVSLTSTDLGITTTSTLVITTKTGTVRAFKNG